MTKIFDHAVTIAFSLRSATPDGSDCTAQELRHAILSRLAALGDGELLEAIGAPFDTYEVELPVCKHRKENQRMTTSTKHRPVKQRVRCGSWRTFERRFRPMDGPGGALTWHFEQLPKDVDPHRIWTITDCDGRLTVTPGYRFVNRIDYVLCEVPWTDEDALQPDYRYD